MIQQKLYLFFISCACFLFAVPDLFLDPDVAWHIKTGQKILTDMAIPNRDTWTYSSDQTWYLISWAWDVIIYLLYKSVGLNGLYIVHTSLLSCFVVYAMHLLTKLQYKKEPIYMAIGLLMLVQMDFLTLRPQIFAYFFAISALYILITNKTLWLLPIITILWANSHGTFILMFLLIGVYFLVSAYHRELNSVYTYIKYGTLCVLAACINPFGYEIYIGVARTLNSVIFSFIQEWYPFTFGSQFGCTIILIVFALLSRFDKSIPIQIRCITYLMILASLMSIRNFVFLSILGLPYLSLCLKQFLETTKDQKPFFPSLFQKYAIFLILLLNTLSIAHFVIKEKTLQINTTAFNYIKDHCSNDAHIFNDYNLGGLTIWHLSDYGYKHYIDGRAGTAFSEELLSKFIKFGYSASKDTDRFEDMNKADAVILYKNLVDKTSIANALKLWDNVYQSDTIYLYFNPDSKRCLKQ